MIFENVAVHRSIHFKVVGQISGMEVSVDSIIEKSFFSRNYDEKLDTAKAKKPTPTVDIIKLWFHREYFHNFS